VAALEKAGKLNRVKVVGFDGMPEGKQAIKNGQIYADPVQFPDKIGRTAVANDPQISRGDDIQSQILIPTGLYYKADAEKDAGLVK